MDVSVVEQLIAQVDEMIEMMFEDEEQCLIPLEIAQHLRDELVQLLPEDAEEE